MVILCKLLNVFHIFKFFLIFLLSSCIWADDKTVEGPDTCRCHSPSFRAFLIKLENEETLSLLRNSTGKRKNESPENSYQQPRKKLRLSSSSESLIFEDLSD